jgi:hypothetical protein
VAVLGGAEEIEIDSLAMALISSNLKYIELRSRDIEGLWPELSNGALGTYVVAFWAPAGDSRCSRYSEFIANRPSPSRMALPWLKGVPKDRCLALESAGVAKSQYELKTLMPDQNNVRTWVCELTEIASHKVYASQPVAARQDRVVPNGCAVYYEELNKLRFKAIITPQTR